MRHPLKNDAERQQMLALVRRSVWNRTGTALHFGYAAKEDDMIAAAVETAYDYFADTCDIPVSSSPQDMLRLLESEAGSDGVTVLRQNPDAIKVKLRNRVWWLCRALFSPYDSRRPFAVSHVGVSADASAEHPGRIFPVGLDFGKIIPMLDELLPDIETEALSAMMEKLGGRID